MSSNVVYQCDRCSVVQAGPTTLHRIGLVISAMGGIEQAEKSADWCDTCLISVGMQTNGVLDLTHVPNLTVSQLAVGFSAPLVP
jgi:hypothetical protein